MSWRSLLIAVFVLFAGGVLFFAAVVKAPAVEEHTLLERCALSEPTWQGYPEDIKAQIGAAPVAEWDGEVLAASLEEGVLRLEVELSGPWVDRPYALPILLRDPAGQVHLSRTAEGEGPRRSYLFEVPQGGAMTWVEAITPDGRRRITLGPERVQR